MAKEIYSCLYCGLEWQGEADEINRLWLDHLRNHGHAAARKTTDSEANAERHQ